MVAPGLIKIPMRDPPSVAVPGEVITLDRSDRDCSPEKEELEKEELDMEEFHDI